MELVFALISDLHFGKEAGYDGKLRKLTRRRPGSRGPSWTA